MPKAVTIMGRSSSITNSLINGIIPIIEPSEIQIKEALTVLEQTENDVRCVYCGDKKTEWDHLYPLIIDKKHSGYITEIANLVPACGKCNQSKGNANWKEWMLSNAEKSPKSRKIPDLYKRIQIIENYDKHFQKTKINLKELAGNDLWTKYQCGYESIIFAMQSTQNIMDEIKNKISPAAKTADPKIQNTENTKKVYTVKKRIVSTNIHRSDSTTLEGYRLFLIEQGYKEFTPSHLPSTVPQYVKAITDILRIEDISVQQLANNINSIIHDYNIGGIKEALGKRGHNTWISALRKFSDYINI